MRSAVDYVESLSPWPQDGFGLDRIVALLAELGDPQRAYPSIHVVGTNGKGTTTRTIEETLAGEGLLAGGYYSPHVTGWAERIRVNGAEADFERAIERVRQPAERLGATQFEVLTAAALAEFAEASVDVAAVEAGLGGRFDATNVLDAPVVVLTNVALEHTDVLGDTRERDCRREAGGRAAGRDCGARRSRSGRGLRARTARPRSSSRRAATPRSAPPPHLRSWAGASCRFTSSCRAGSSGAATSSGTVRTRRRPCATSSRTFRRSARSPRRSSPTRTSRECCGSCQRMRPRSSRRRPAMHERFPPRSSPPSRSRSSRHVEAVEDPVRAVERARELGTPVLVTGSLYLLADLAVRSTRVA